MTLQTAINHLLWACGMISGLAEKSMAYNRSYIPMKRNSRALRRFIRHRLFEFRVHSWILVSHWRGTGHLVGGRPVLQPCTDQIAKNYLGYPGAVIADESAAVGPGFLR